MTKLYRNQPRDRARQHRDVQRPGLLIMNIIHFLVPVSHNQLTRTKMTYIHYTTSDDLEAGSIKLGGNRRMTTSQAILSGDNRASMFALDEEQQTILDQADRFAHKELYPLSERMDREEWWPDEAFPKIGDNGFFGATIPEEYGGAGLDLLAAGLVLDGFARWNHALALSWVAHDNLCAHNIYRNGNEQQRRKYLPDPCAGRKIGALGLTAPGAGSDALGSMRTTARRDGDHYVLNGGKIYITNGPVA